MKFMWTQLGGFREVGEREWRLSFPYEAENAEDFVRALKDKYECVGIENPSHNDLIVLESYLGV